MSGQDITGVVLAGGRATRWDGRDKGLIAVLGRPMISHVLDALAPQVGQVLISANRNLDEYRAFGLPVGFPRAARGNRQRPGGCTHRLGGDRTM